MGVVDERARRLGHVKSTLAHGGQCALRCAMGGDHDMRGGEVGDLVLDGYSLSAKLGEDTVVVHQVAEDGEGVGPRVSLGQRERIAHAEAHAQVSGTKNLHTELGRAPSGTPDFGFKLSSLC